MLSKMNMWSRTVQKLSFILVIPIFIFIVIGSGISKGGLGSIRNRIWSNYSLLITSLYNTSSDSRIKMEFLRLRSEFIVPSKVLYSFSLIPLSCTTTILIIKVIHSNSMIVANFIDCYLLGILAVLMNRLFYLVPFGRIIGAYSSYSSSQRPLFPSLLTPLLEPFPNFSQSLTLSNRLSINMPAGSSLTGLLSVTISFFIFYVILCNLVSWFPLLTCILEVLNSLLQLGIFILLSIEYNNWRSIPSSLIH